MNDDTLARALASADQTKAVDLGRGLLTRSGELLKRTMAAGGDRPFLLVADENTWRVAGHAVTESLQAAGAPIAQPLVFPAQPTLYASLDNADSVRDEILHRDQNAGTSVVPVAVGAGTLNDLVKLAANKLDRRYAVVGTAASMDGYTGAGAPTSDNGVKVTINCVAPQAVVFDLDIAAAAPKWMTASGYGDLSAKIPGGADWILADAAGIEAIDPNAWAMVQGGVITALAHPDQLAKGNADAFHGLVDGLVLSGLAMQAYGGTRPASGAEHYFSHLWELDHVGADHDPPLSHGFKVAIGTLAMLTFYEAFLTRDLSALDIDHRLETWPTWDDLEADIRGRFVGALADHAVNETKAKYLPPDRLRVRLETLRSNWPETRQRLHDQLMPAAEFQTKLRAVGAPSVPEQIGLTPNDVRDTFSRAMYYRSRYTVLDVAREAGWFEHLLEQTFNRTDIWH